jgi:hypothetical protein
MVNNTINWGQGAVNNDIGWGQGVLNNFIDWGYIHALSYGHPETNLTGGDSAGARLLADAYVLRVEADGGVVEGYECLVDKIVALGIESLEDYQALIATQDYVTRVLADSGIAESSSCVEDAILILLEQ